MLYKFKAVSFPIVLHYFVIFSQINVKFHIGIHKLLVFMNFSSVLMG